MIEVKTVDASDNLIFSAAYTLGPDGSRWQVVEKTAAHPAGRTVQYTYDALGRLVLESDLAAVGDFAHDVAYTYDLASNRLSRAEADETPALPNNTLLTYSYNANDQLQTVQGTEPTTPGLSITIVGTTTVNDSYTYDLNGNTLTATTNETTAGVIVSKTTTDTWNIEGRLIESDTTDGTTTQHVADTYDDAGNRVSETVDGQTTTFLNDPNNAYDQVLEEYAPGGVLLATYVRGLDLIFQDRPTLSQPATPVPSYYIVDGLGSTRALTNSAGVVTDTYTYDAFGNLTASTGTTTNEFLYAGYQTDAATGLDYLRARYLDTAVGRFSSRDSYDGTLQDPITLNHFIYTNSDPVNGYDPSGRTDLGSLNVNISLTTTIVSILVASAVFAVFARYGTFANAWFFGAGKIREYAQTKLPAVEALGPYINADLPTLFSSYASIYPNVTSRACGDALDGLMTALKPVVKTKPAMRNGIVFTAALMHTTGAEPDNILILLPSQYNNNRDLSQLSNPAWYNNDAKKNILFFYPGSVPVRPVDTLYNAIVNRTFGTFVSLEVPQEQF